MRVKADDQNLAVAGPCANSSPLNLYSQVKDYAVMIVDPVGIEEKSFNNGIKLFPNPSNGTISIEMAEDLKGNYQLEVQDLVGKTVAEKQLKLQSSNVLQIDLSYLPKGVYFLKLSNEKSAAVKKIVIE